MTDRELLELAAKAAGIVVIRSRLDDPLARDMLVANGHRNPHHETGPWNPLTDDGDALRLAVKLSISFSDDYLYPNGERVVRVGCVYGDALYGDQVVCGNDPLAATRRAIVRAAAEIGRSRHD